MSVKITPTYARLRVRNGRRPSIQARATMTRWLERGARRKGKHINEPSVQIIMLYDVMFRQAFLYAQADSFRDTWPDWLRTVDVASALGL